MVQLVQHPTKTVQGRHRTDVNSFEENLPPSVYLSCYLHWIPDKPLQM